MSTPFPGSHGGAPRKTAQPGVSAQPGVPAPPGASAQLGGARFGGPPAVPFGAPTPGGPPLVAPPSGGPWPGWPAPGGAQVGVQVAGAQVGGAQVGGAQVSGGGERWGWELHAPDVAVPVPFEERPPGLPPTRAPWLARLADRRDRSAQGWLAHAGRVCGAVFCGGLTWLSTGLPWGFAGWVTGGLTAATVVTAAVAVRPMALPWWTDVRYRRWRQRLLDQQRTVVDQTREWARRRAEHDARLANGVRPERWEPLRPATTHRVDVYGGDPVGGSALLMSVVGSLLDSGTATTVVDLSQDGLCREVAGMARQHGRLAQAALLPDDLAALDLLGGLAPEDVGGVVAEAVHVAERDRSAGGDRTLDVTLVEQVCRTLTEPVTFTRLHAALRVVAYQEPCPDVLHRSEYDALVDLLGEGARRSTEARLFRLAAAVQRLAALEPTPMAPGEEDPRPDGGRGDGRSTGTSAGAQPTHGGPGLRVWELSDRVGELAGELLAHVVFQVLLHRLRHDDGSLGRVLVLTGADRFRRTHLERLDQLARRRGVRLVLLFRHLRDDAVEVLGGGEAVMFLRLGNAKEAEHAATFIGREHRLVLSQLTVSRSSSLSTTVGTSRTESVSDQKSVSTGKQWSHTRNYHYGALLDFPHDSGSRNRGGQRTTTTGSSTSTSTGESTSEQQGTSESQSVGLQRVYEFTVEPSFLQALPSTAFVLVDPRDPGSPRIGDCAPELGRPMAQHPQPLRPFGPLAPGARPWVAGGAPPGWRPQAPPPSAPGPRPQR